MAVLVQYSQSIVVAGLSLRPWPKAHDRSSPAEEQVDCNSCLISHSVKDITTPCQRGDRIAASMLTSVHTDGVAQAFSLLHGPPRLAARTAPPDQRQSKRGVRAAPCTPSALELTDSEKVWPSQSCVFLLPPCLGGKPPHGNLPAWPACLPACLLACLLAACLLLALSQVSPAPRLQTPPKCASVG
jgi:hypothetical protein